MWQSSGASTPSVIVSGPSSVISKNTAMSVVTSSVALKAVWTLSRPGSTNAVPAG